MAMSHETCTHPRDPKGRAWCRANGGPGSGAVWGQPSTRAKAPTKDPAVAAKVQAGIVDAPPVVRTKRASLSAVLRDLPRLFHVAVDWARDNGCTVTPHTKGSSRLIDLTNDNGTLTLTWSPTTPDGVNRVSFRPAGTSITTVVTDVNSGLAKLKG